MTLLFVHQGRDLLSSSQNLILVRNVFRKSAFLPTFSLSSFWLNSYRRDCYVSGLRCSRFVRTLRVLPTWLLVFVRVRFQAALFYPF